MSINNDKINTLVKSIQEMLDLIYFSDNKYNLNYIETAKGMNITPEELKESTFDLLEEYTIEDLHLVKMMIEEFNPMIEVHKLHFLILNFSSRKQKWQKYNRKLKKRKLEEVSFNQFYFYKLLLRKFTQILDYSEQIKENLREMRKKLGRTKVNQYFKIHLNQIHRILKTSNDSCNYCDKEQMRKDTEELIRDQGGPEDLDEDNHKVNSY